MLDPIDFWKFHDTLTASESALLMLDKDPSIYSNYSDYNISTAYETILGALQKDIRAERLDANIFYDMETHYSNTEPDIDWNKTIIHVSVLKKWLLSKNFKPAFFFSEETGTPDYLDKNHPRYSDKLAATVKAWLAMEDDQLLKGKSPILAMESFLTNKYKEFGLIYKQNNSKSGYKIGDMNKGAINEITKIANWKDKGGAPSTPTSKPIPPLEDIDNIDEFPF